LILSIGDFILLLFLSVTLGMDALHEVKDGAGLDGDFIRAYSNMNGLRLTRRGRMGMDKINSRSKNKNIHMV
jgi:hypothetical protein